MSEPINNDALKESAIYNNEKQALAEESALEKRNFAARLANGGIDRMFDEMEAAAINSGKRNNWLRKFLRRLKNTVK